MAVQTENKQIDGCDLNRNLKCTCNRITDRQCNKNKDKMIIDNQTTGRI